VSQQSARYQRSPRGLIGALVVLVVLVIGWVGLRSLIFPTETTPVATVDYAQVVPSARKSADFDLLAPPRLPAHWRATTVGFSDSPGRHWHLGVLTDKDRYVGLEQGNESVRSMVEAYVDDAAARGGPVSVAGRPWATYTDRGGDLALVRRVGRTTTLVVGHEVPRSTLVAYAGSLR
jgi:Protein of unknown function (DUF4245)